MSFSKERPLTCQQIRILTSQQIKAAQLVQRKAVWPLGVRQCPDKGGAVLREKRVGSGGGEARERDVQHPGCN